MTPENWIELAKRATSLAIQISIDAAEDLRSTGTDANGLLACDFEALTDPLHSLIEELGK